VQAVRKFAEEAWIPLVAERNEKTEGYFTRSKKAVLTTFFEVEFVNPPPEDDETPQQDQVCFMTIPIPCCYTECGVLTVAYRILEVVATFFQMFSPPPPSLTPSNQQQTRGK
jgi:hypothetical protein